MANSAEHRLHDLIEGFDTAMLVTNIAKGNLHARPMGVAEITELGEIYFVTAARSAKVKEIQQNSALTLIFQSRLKFVSLHGNGAVVEDRALIDRLWSEAWKVWFPKGKTDPSLRIIKVLPKEAEYWDSTGTQGISYAFEAAKAYIRGETPDVSEKQHGKISL